MNVVVLHVAHKVYCYLNLKNRNFSVLRLCDCFNCRNGSNVSPTNIQQTDPASVAPNVQGAPLSVLPNVQTTTSGLGETTC